MEQGFKIANLEATIDVAKQFSSATGTRKKHRDYFLEGIRADSKRMVRAARKSLALDLAYVLFPTFLRPFNRLVSDHISDSSSVVFSAAKCIHDNLNRFLQASYLPEEEIERREERVVHSQKDFASALGDEYSLKRVARLKEMEGEIPGLGDLEELYALTSAIVSPIRDATEHGHSHAVLERDVKQGHLLSERIAKNTPRHNISGLTRKVSLDYLHYANLIVAGSLPEAVPEKVKEKAERPYFMKWVGLPWITAMGIGFSALYGLASMRTHPSLKDLEKADVRIVHSQIAQYERNLIDAERNYEKLVGDVRYLSQSYQDLQGFDLFQRVNPIPDLSNRVERLKELMNPSKK